MREISTTVLVVMLGWCVGLSIVGCKSGKKGFSLVKMQAAEEIKMADKITGVESLKMADSLKADAEVTAQGGFKNSTSKTEVGGNQINDSEVIKEYMKRDAEKSADIVLLYRYIVGLFGVLLLKSYIIIFWVLKNILNAKDKDDAAEEKRMGKLIDNVIGDKNEPDTTAQQV